MVRFALPLALLPLATAAVAQTADVPADTAAKAAAARAERNAVLTKALPPEQAAMKAHVMFLASDAMRGREAGSEEYDIAAQYVASQFYAAGLRPAGDDGGYLQRVPLVSYKPADKGSFALGTDGRKRKLTFGEEYVPSGNPEAAVTKVGAPIVLVGQGIVAPGHDRDDYAGVDVRGKIVAVVRGAPESYDGEQRAHFGSTSTKAAIAAAHGAAGVVILDPGSLERAAKYYDHARVTWADAQGNGHPAAPGTPILGTIGGKAAGRLLDAAGLTADDLTSERFRAVALPVTLTATVNTAREAMESSNVAGILPGSDPQVGDQVVVLSAHLDHVGVGDPDDTGDTIYNGAEDNAVGIASLIEEARRFKASGKPPKRSILFLAVTAEEKGLVGSDYFARHPTVPKDKLVADVNLDMPILTYPFEDVIAFGAERSTLGPIVKQAARDAGVAFSPDPMPEMGLFVRSDHYRFVQQGIPSVFLWPGEKGPGKAAVEEFFDKHYHQPSDQIGKSGIDWAQGVRFIDVNYQIARQIADAEKRPAWNRGDFFGTLYHGYGAK
ncbi:M20/M25/M40 family metallo-hydrolase [Stakelama saccharophila]|uniref:M20/M25/M40 family metallo-hydrolase n=1 Tax=Stakelama saccharophila TaxID=3075605 RepID=A0ABZ0BAA0_9SPHN|nr:M20/M25/M40 family metallo-hydrolase [Stakelama sp. W311]WNO54336.1 M20/M25/M40 family metallo-hydrolase [Stakelama sp. W311]